ncbi:Nn.00g050490.m01.CDS01 [Neocucurbitaria sp. VM-36]
MAPNGHVASGLRDARQSQPSSLRSWLDEHGNSEFETWQHEHPTQHLSYDDWKTSQHVDGLSLYYAALHLFEESDSSDEETEIVEMKPRARAVRGQSARESKKKVTINGNGLSRGVGSATPSALANSEDLSSSGKKRRKARKKYLSEEIVASDGDSELEERGTSTPITEAATSIGPIGTVDGPRKSSSARKTSRKKILSDEIISPEDEVDDSVGMDEVVTPGIASPLPVRSAPRPSTTAESPALPKKTILKLSTRKAPKKKILSDETVLDEDTDDAKAPVPASAPPLTTSAAANPNVNASTSDIADAASNPDSNLDATNSSSKIAEESAASSRRGLRTRRPAQKRPYFHDAQLFDEVEPEASDATDPSPNARSRRLSVASLSKSHNETPLEELDAESIALLQEDPESEPSERKPKHFKGKGRAWKKEESDEDEEFTLAKRKAARAAKAKAKGQVVAQKKRGRPRKSVLSEDIIRDESDSDAVEKDVTFNQSESPGRASQEHLGKAKATPKKSALSEEIVRDDSESTAEKEVNDDTVDNAPAPEVPSTGPKKRGRPRKSDQSTTSKSSTLRDEEVEAHSPKESWTPQGTPKSKSIPRKPDSPLSSVQDTETKKSNIDTKDTELPKDSDLTSPLGKKSVSGGEEPQKTDV